MAAWEVPDVMLMQKLRLNHWFAAAARAMRSQRDRLVK
jgi:hypothetical protein